MVSRPAMMSATHTLSVSALSAPTADMNPPPAADAVVLPGTQITNVLTWSGVSLPVAFGASLTATGYALYFAPTPWIAIPAYYSNRTVLNLSTGTTPLKNVPARVYFKLASIAAPLGAEAWSNEIQWPPATNVTVTAFCATNNTIVPLSLTNPPNTLFRLSLGQSAAMWQTSTNARIWVNGPGFPTPKLGRITISIVKTNW
jgi:hypothetical protein